MKKDIRPTFVSRRTLLQAAALSPVLALLPDALQAAPSGGFTHSVASGDPLQESVTLWTRFVPADGGVAALRVEIAHDTAFRQVVARGSALAGPESYFCAKVRLEGLEPGQWYYYRFTGPEGQISDTGRTRTLPAGPLDNFRIGVFSCANATSGWFNAYGHAAARDDLDLVVHLGDYIYESKLTRSDALKELAISRNIQPQYETVSLMDYRLRYASYRLDPDLQAIHRAYPMIAMCDDHETVNNSWQHGAKNHGAHEGPWDARRDAAMQAWHEWMPMRSDPYARYDLGDLASLFRLETRIVGRSKQLDLGAWLKARPDPLAAAAAFRDGPLADPARTMMGLAQEKWLADGLAQSTASGTKWQILAQQVIMGTNLMPRDYTSWFKPGDKPGEGKKAELDLAVKLGEMGMSTHMDRWDGYPAARSRLLAASRAAGADLVVLSGDSHNAWAYELEHEGKPAGVEFAGHSVSSLGMDKRYFGDPRAIAASFLDSNPGLKWCDTSRRGYMVTDITPESVTTEWLFLHSRHQRSLEVLDRHRMQVRRGMHKLSEA
ncbi:alkaline phosphatase D family protein [Emcibacter sp.]|uniref:alkaline phosphatase D family protein n=1 Tax=Emcibacter sp. TaxID=1979954 RepID=UPI003A8F3DF4